MKLEIKAMMDMTGKSHEPDFDPGDCLVMISVEIGPESEDGGHRFDFIAITHKFLRRAPGCVWGRSLLIFDRFEWVEIENTIEKLVSSVAVQDLDEGVKNLSLYMDWEYAGMADIEGKVAIPASVDVVQARLTAKTI
jgi:hypothetical protein